MNLNPIRTGLLALILTVSQSKAIVLFQDGFAYPGQPGAIQTVSGGVWVPGAGNTLTGDISVSGNAAQLAGSSPADLPRAYFTNGIGATLTGVPNFAPAVSYFTSNAPVAALYASFVLNVPDPTTVTNTYIAYLTDTNFDFAPRIFVVTNTASDGFYRVAIDNFNSPFAPDSSDNILQQDLSGGISYTVVVRYNLSTGQATLWVNPDNETSPGLDAVGADYIGGAGYADVSGTNIWSNSSICGFGLRNHIGGGPLTISSLIVGTTFEDVVPASAGSNPPFISTPPQSTACFVGGSASFSVVAGGDTDGLSFHWKIGGVSLTDGIRGDGSVISGSATSTLTIQNAGNAEQAAYSVTVANTANASGVSAGASLSVVVGPIQPSITTQPTNTSVTLGGTTSFSVGAADGGPPLVYQWYFGVNAIPFQTNSTLVLQNVTFNQAGNYSVKVTNPYGNLTSSNAVLTVSAPPSVTIQYLRSLLDPVNYNTNGAPTLYTVQGTVTTWTNLTTAGNSEFYIQDATAGIAVFWGGAPASTNLPPAGAIVRVTAPLSEFRGLLELAPTFGNPFQTVSVVSTGNPLPAPQQLAFDPNVTGNPDLMQKHIVGSYLVASNVFLDLSSGPTFASNGNDPTTNGFLSAQSFPISLYNSTSPTTGTNYFVTATNLNGETFIVFYNSHTDIAGAPKPTGPVTIYGVMGIFTTTTPNTSGYEFTPSRLADIVPAIRFTNVLSNPPRLGDLLTNTFSENTLQPGESITISVVVTDPGGGNVTLSTSGDLTGNWNILSSGGRTATATFTFTATAANAGHNYAVSLLSSFTSSGVTSTKTWTLYVPTVTEQQVYITEVFASPTTNTNSPAFNPLHRNVDNLNVTVNDQYVELANVSGTDLDLFNWTIGNGTTTSHTFFNGGTPEGGNEELFNHNSFVVYGGPLNDTQPPVLSGGGGVEPANPGPLGYLASGGIVTLHNAGGFLVDRVVYPANAVPGSFSRFPTVNRALVPQAYISTNYATPGLQYDGGLWSSATKVPQGILPAAQITGGNPLKIAFTADPTRASTLWESTDARSLFNVIYGQQFTNNQGVFYVTNPPPPFQFYFITTQ